MLPCDCAPLRIMLSIRKDVHRARGGVVAHPYFVDEESRASILNCEMWHPAHETLLKIRPSLQAGIRPAEIASPDRSREITKVRWDYSPLPAGGDQSRKDHIGCGADRRAESQDWLGQRKHWRPMKRR